ncbi:hypothetical protein MCOR25_011100 [Pyricularia grisea]|uniref:Uncharacterized protein n=1 Tax=Pyricularia grisea TaxID=148305 RepID=A0A6P8BFZ8_PYRGI|nr:uncharacterized protein PgNI_00114 [Pyricularia grisea]KAI6344242.1 hypothetical protein MCOR25_011100 [Pyricularia grisea]TLD15645.1 hypothetical protein PgNI_00114 [Pyricularia grisea]
MDDDAVQVYLSQAAEIARDRLMSYPRAQFESHLLDEAQAMIQAVAEGLCVVEVGFSILDAARSVVKHRWQAAGLWPWDPLLRSPPADGAEWPGPRTRNTAPCAAGTPMALFTLEMGVRRWRLGLRGGREALDSLDEVLPANINDIVYAEVRDEWQSRGIWDQTWVCLPGQLWKHQRPLEDVLFEQLGEPPAGVDADQVVPLQLEVPGGFDLFVNQPVAVGADGEWIDPPPAYEQGEYGRIQALSSVTAASQSRNGSRRDSVRAESRAAVEHRRRRRHRPRARSPSQNPHLGREREF